MKNLLYLGNKLAKHGNTPSSVDILPAQFEAMGFNIKAVSSKKNKVWRLLDMLITIFKLRHWTQAILIDTYSTQNFYFAVASAKLARLFKIEYYPVLRGGKLPERLKTSPKLCNQLFRNAKLNIVPSQFLLEIFKAEGFENLIHIPNTIKLSEYPFTERIVDMPKLLWVRSFSKIYNPLLAIDVFKKLKEKYPEAQLCMVGPEKDGSLADCRQYAEDLNLDITFKGKLEKMEWHALSNNYNLFINTTNFDNTPISVIEAMALGLPVVSTNVGGLPYLIKHEETGFLVPPKDATAFSTAIDQFVNSPENTLRICRNARQSISVYDWEVIKKDWKSLFI